MHRRQRGMSMLGILLVVAVIVIGAIGGMKVAPAYLEYYKVKKAVTSIAGGGGGTVADVRKAFERRATIDDISVVGGQDLEITKEGGEIVVSFAYVKKVPLFSNISLLIEFSGSSNR